MHAALNATALEVEVTALAIRAWRASRRDLWRTRRVALVANGE